MVVTLWERVLGCQGDFEGEVKPGLPSSLRGLTLNWLHLVLAVCPQEALGARS